jgi:hypothetical protein
MKIIEYKYGQSEVIRLLGYAVIYELCKRATSRRSYEVETGCGLLRVYKTIDRETGDHVYHVYFYAQPLRSRILETLRELFA